MMSLKRQQGVVIVVALFFVALIATMATLMMARLERDTERTSLLLHATQAELYAQGSIAWAKEQLRDNLAKRKPNEVVDKMPLKSPEDTVDGYHIVSTITDLQSRFNLNNLTNNNVEAQKDFKHLLKLVMPTLTDDKATGILLAVTDWITPGQRQNEYSQYYASLSPPYRAADRVMTSVSELQLVKGMTPALFDALQPFVTALPVATQVNVQTAPGEVLAALSDTMTIDSGKAIEKLRAQLKIPTVEAFLAIDLVKNHKILPDKITTVSAYFLVETVVSIEKQRVVLYTLLERTGNDGKNPINVIWQSKSVMG